jgi:WD40 repeat protein
VKLFKSDSDVIDIDWQNTTDLASSLSDNTICLWSFSSGNPTRVWRGHTSSIGMIKWDPAGVLLASCADDDDVALLWAPSTNEFVKRLAGHTKSINSLRWSNT